MVENNGASTNGAFSGAAVCIVHSLEHKLYDT